MLAAVLWSLAAQAHGGFPWATDVQVGPDGPVVVANFGVLFQEDDTWSWICEEVVGSTGMTDVVVLDDGVWLAGSIGGVYRSTDHCTWTNIGGELEPLFVTQLAHDAVLASRVWATTATGDLVNALWVSDDGGQTFSAYASFGEGSTLRGFGQGASGLPLAASGWRDGEPLLWRSEDGETWTEQALTVPEDSSVYLLGVDASGAVWMRYTGASEDLLVRVDAQGTAEGMREHADAISAFDLGPGADEVYVGTQATGLAGSTDGGQTWSSPTPSPTPNCLRTVGDTRYLCAHNWSDGAAAWRMTRSGGDPADWDWTPVLWFGDVHQMASCAEGTTVATVCAPLWENVAASSGLDLERADTSDPTPPKTEGSCGCGDGGQGAIGGGWLLLVGTASLRRRRARC